MSARLVNGTWCNTEVCHWLDPSMWTLKPPRVTDGEGRAGRYCLWQGLGT